jgi:hypothetical protein
VVVYFLVDLSAVRHTRSQSSHIIKLSASKTVRVESECVREKNIFSPIVCVHIYGADQDPAKHAKEDFLKLLQLRFISHFIEKRAHLPRNSPFPPTHKMCPSGLLLLLPLRVARFFLVHNTKTGKNVPNKRKMLQMVIKYPKCRSNIPNGHKIYHHFPIWGPQKFTQIGVFGLQNKPSGNPAAAGATLDKLWLADVVARPHTTWLLLVLRKFFLRKRKDFSKFSSALESFSLRTPEVAARLFFYRQRILCIYETNLPKPYWLSTCVRV